MMWHDGRFGRDNRFLFYLYDRIRRWNAALGVHLKVKNDRESVDKFNRLILDPLISDRVTQAAANPANRDARLLMNLLKPLLVVSGRRVPFGPAERNDSISKMCAMVHYAGLPLWFWTVSPSDIDSTPALRIAGIDVEFQLPSLQERTNIIAANPVAAARGFQALINSVLRCLFNQEPQESTRTSTLPGLQEWECLMCGGECLGYFAVTETQGRGSLHMHGCLLCSLGPTLLERCQADSDLAAQIANVIDSVLIAALPEGVHEIVQERRIRREAGPRVSLQSGRIGPLPNVGDGDDFQDLLQQVIAATNLHTHSSTCKKGNTRVGREQYRLSFARGVKDDGTMTNPLRYAQ
eukprot:scpid92217/ scgid3232/ 